MKTLFQKSALVNVLLVFVFGFAQARGAKAPEIGVDVQTNATEAAIWGMPIVAMDAMRQAYFRDAHAQYNDVVILSKGWKNQVTTPNSSSIYLYFNYNLANGPVVVDIPAAVGGGIFGSFNNAWQKPLADYGPKGEDFGKGGKYILIPPDFKAAIPPGYIEVKSDTINGYSVVRAIPLSNSDDDTRKVMELAAKLKVYPIEQAENPHETRFIDMRDKLFDGIAAMDERFFQSLARMVNEEPVLPEIGRAHV